MASPTVIWHGTQQDSNDLVNAIAHNCACEFGLMGVRMATCGPHAMLIEDQRALNGLLFARRIAERLRQEEACLDVRLNGSWTSKDETGKLFAEEATLLHPKAVEEPRFISSNPGVAAD